MQVCAFLKELMGTFSSVDAFLELFCLLVLRVAIRFLSPSSTSPFCGPQKVLLASITIPQPQCVCSSRKLSMVRVGAKRERPCVVLLHVALRAAAASGTQRQQQQQHAGATGAAASPTAAPECCVWKSRRTAEIYASAALSRVRAWWEMLGGVRYGLPDAVRLTSCVWAGKQEAPVSRGGAAGAAAVASKPLTTQSKKEAAAAGKRQRRASATARRSGVLRCAVQLSRSLYGDAAALHIFRAACACVTEVHVSMPMSRLSAKEGEDAVSVKEVKAKSRRQRTEDGGPRMEQGCHAAVRVARVEHVVSSRKQ